MQLSKEFFPTETDLALDVKVKMIYGDNEDDIIGQYVLFTKVYDEQRKLYGRTQKATKKANEQAIANIVTIYKQVDGSMDAAIQNVMTMYGYSEEDATAIVQKYWNEVPVTINIQLSKED